MTSVGTPTGRVRPFARGLAVVIVPFLVAAVALLYLLPTRTDQLFAWTIAPPMTAMLLGSAYAGGIWFFVSVARGGRWHLVRYGFPAVVLFSSLMAVATIVHWDRFHAGHISFAAWATLYLTTPFLTLAAALWNRSPARDADEYAMPAAPRIAIGSIGLAALLSGLALFVFPVEAGQYWAWEVTPLTARVVGAVLTLPGMVNVFLFVDDRWSAFRGIFIAELVSLVFILGATAVRIGDFEWSRPASGLFVGGIAASFSLYLAFFLWCERRTRTAARTREHA